MVTASAVSGTQQQQQGTFVRGSSVGGFAFEIDVPAGIFGQAIVVGSLDGTAVGIFVASAAMFSNVAAVSILSSNSNLRIFFEEINQSDRQR